MLKKAARRVHREGVRDTAAWAWHRIGEEVQEWRLGIRTKGYILPDELGLGETSVAYSPTRYSWIRHAHRHMRLTPGADVLLEYGTGMGRVVAAMSRLAFRRIIGVEISPRLADIARENVARVRRSLCERVEIVQCDAAEFVPPSDVTRVFLYNPFHPPVIDVVGHRLAQSVEEHPRHLRVVYLYSIVDGNHLASWDWLQSGYEVPIGTRHPIRMMVYDHHP